jgi:hypothetical protein
MPANPRSGRGDVVLKSNEGLACEAIVGYLVDIPCVPFAVCLVRFEPPLIPGPHFGIKLTTTAGDQARSIRMKRAIDGHFPKLFAWKRDDRARTIFVLECNDIQLTNPSNVTDTFVPQAEARVDRPDETYLIMSCMEPWHIFPISIDDKTYYDLARNSETNIY